MGHYMMKSFLTIESWSICLGVGI